MAEEESIMMTFYAAAGSYQIRNEDGKDMPYIITRRSGQFDFM